MDWRALQNGSDIRGVALASAGGTDADVNLTPAVVRRIGSAFARWLGRALEREPQALTIAVGRDSRISGPALAAALSEGIAAEGARVLDFGLASTPAMFMSTVTPSYRCDGAVMLTASHLPPHRNGCKFFTARGGLNREDITTLLELAGSGDLKPPGTVGPVEEIDFMSAYASQLVERVRQGAAHPEHPERPLRGLKIVVDAGNGAGGFFVDRVLEPLGADTTGSRFLEPDGSFPGHVPNPEHPDAMAALREAVLARAADFGIAFDPDVDRAAAMDGSGREINRNRLVALAAAVVLREHPGTTIVTDSVTSDGLTEFIEEGLGGVHHRFRRGYRNVINEAVRLNAAGEPCWLAIETSGHAALKENHFLDDGAYLVAMLLIELARARRGGRDLGDLIAELREPAESREYRLGLPAQDFAARGERILDALRERVAAEPDWEVVPDTHEGVRVTCRGPGEQGWFLLRLSLHDPVLPLNVESEVSGGADRIERRLARLLSAMDRSMDLDALDARQRTDAN
ncbi:MAG: phosphomannomutase/phosphoglucomutase [Thioalkalivibrio sp.]|nr:phosphomannomutase/phosphoglucomutase [Thioalkalivibrio sp.]